MYVDLPVAVIDWGEAQSTQSRAVPIAHAATALTGNALGAMSSLGEPMPGLEKQKWLETVAKDGDKVAVTYTGTFAAGTVYEGVDYSGKKFDSTLDHGQQPKKGPKQHKPLAFVLGQGKAIRGWEECVKKMSLGEKLTVTIGPKWAYRKAGLQDDNGKVIVPPNATLIFEMRLVQVRDHTVEPN